MTMRLWLLTALTLFPAFASAQSIELFASTGVVQVWDDEGNIGAGMPLGGGIGFTLPHGWGVEALAERQKATRHFDSGVQFDSTVTAGGGRIIKYFGRGRTPYAGVSLGVTRVKSARSEPFGGSTFRTTTTAGTVGGFAGVRIPAGDRLFARPEFDISKAGEHIRIGGTIAVGASW